MWCLQLLDKKKELAPFIGSDLSIFVIVKVEHLCYILMRITAGSTHDRVVVSRAYMVV